MATRPQPRLTCTAARPENQETVADRLVVRGAREHNLKDVSLDLPRDSMIVFTGLSGSGKSSLAFDTIFAEGQRRYVESLSAYARQFLGQMDKPDVDFIDGLSPAVSIDQKAAGRNPRSTVGTITEVYDYLRLLFARVGKPHCPVCGRPIARQTPQQIVDRVLELDEGTRFQVLAPVVRGRKGEYTELLRDLQVKGYSRARVDGAIIRLDTAPAAAGDLPALKKYEKHNIEVVVDRLEVKESARRRLTDSVETALTLSGGVVVLDFVDLPDDDPNRERMYSEHLACLYDDLSFDELEPRSFSFNSPVGRVPGLHRARHQDGSRPGAGRLRPGADAGRRRDRGLERRARQRLLRPADRGARRRARLQHQHALGTAARRRPRRPCCTATTSRCTSGTRTGTAASGLTTPTSRARSPTSSAGTPMPTATTAGSGTPSTCARCRARPATAPGSSRSRSR